jgi:hypothetical protein
MIDPQQRRETINLLKIIGNEEAWDKIYKYIHYVLDGAGEEDSPDVVREPETIYHAAGGGDWAFEDEYAQEVLEAYEASGGKSSLSIEELEECIRISDYCKAHPEKCYTWEEVDQEIRALYEF